MLIYGYGLYELVNREEYKMLEQKDIEILKSLMQEVVKESEENKPFINLQWIFNWVYRDRIK